MNESEAQVASDEGLTLPAPESVFSCDTLRQGDVLTLQEISVVSAEQKTFPTPYGMALISQTCDIVLGTRPNVQVAAVVLLTGDKAKQARDKSQSRYVELPYYHPNAFIDLEYVTSVDKDHLLTLKVARGIDPDDPSEARRVGLSIGRRFSRFPFPDELNPWLSPIVSEIRKKYDRETSALALALKEIAEIRIEAHDWSLRPLDLTIHVIVKAGTIPEIDSEIDDTVVRSEVARFLNLGGDFAGTPAQVAQYIFEKYAKKGPELTGIELNHLWQALADAFCNICKPSESEARKMDVKEAVHRIEGMLWTDDTFPLSRLRRTELLDVDTLSGRTPLPDIGDTSTPDEIASNGQPSHIEVHTGQPEIGYRLSRLLDRLLRRSGLQRGKSG